VQKKDGGYHSVSLSIADITIPPHVPERLRGYFESHVTKPRKQD
tara:strand:+ start:4543 stop:4674 length:132 start_codon:yes stop_codon:yes gene_type:complete